MLLKSEKNQFRKKIGSKTLPIIMFALLIALLVWFQINIRGLSLLNETISWNVSKIFLLVPPDGSPEAFRNFLGQELCQKIGHPIPSNTFIWFETHFSCVYFHKKDIFVTDCQRKHFITISSSNTFKNVSILNFLHNFLQYYPIHSP